MSDAANSPIAFRDAVPEDIPALLEFLSPFFEQRLILARTAKELATLVRHGFLANSEGEIIGFAAIEVYSQKLAEIQSLAVSPRFQGRGIGLELVGRCVARAKAEGVLELMAITASEKLFRDAGFDYSLPNQKRAFFTRHDQKRSGGFQPPRPRVLVVSNDRHSIPISPLRIGS